MYQKPSLAFAGNWLGVAYLFVQSTPLTVNFVRFQELMYEPRLLDFQHKLPVPSKVKGAVMVAFTGLHVLPLLDVGMGVLVRATVGTGVLVRTLVGMDVLVGTGILGVFVRTGVGFDVLFSPMNWIA